MRRGRRRLLLAVLLLAPALAGCHPGGRETTSTPARTPAGASPSAPAVRASAAESPLSAFAARNGLRVASLAPHGHVRLSGDGVQLELAAGLPLLRLNGETHPLAVAPRFRGGVLQIPAEVDRFLAPAPFRPARLADRVVVLDAGHGGHDPGAVHHGLREKDLALDIVRRTATRLRREGVDVILTRDSDTFLDLEDRPDPANRRPGALFVSVHLNAAGGPDAARAQGVETFVLAPTVSEPYRIRQAVRRYDVNATGATGDETAAAGELSARARTESLPLARAIQAALVRTLGEKDRKVKVKNLAVLRECYFGPGVLAEVGFLTHPGTADRLRTSAHRERIADALASGILAHLRAAD